MTRTLTLLAPLLLVACGGGKSVGDGDGIVSDDEVPQIGWQAVLIGEHHDVAGTAVIVDEGTIELRGFVYDGGGVNARLFLLADGEAFHDTWELTDNLVGEPFDGELLTVDIPADAPFEEWNLITVWCVPFAASFGAGVFGPPE
jgi:hypothetical protein